MSGIVKDQWTFSEEKNLTRKTLQIVQLGQSLIIVTFRHYNFELWAEGKRILHNMDLADALSAFLHLAFTFNLKYPQVCTHSELIINQSFQFCLLQKAEYLCDFLQHVVAEYGDEDGTRTSKAKTTAENKRMRYYVQLGKALGMKNVRK